MRFPLRIAKYFVEPGRNISPPFDESISSRARAIKQLLNGSFLNRRCPVDMNILLTIVN